MHTFCSNVQDQGWTRDDPADSDGSVRLKGPIGRGEREIKARWRDMAIRLIEVTNDRYSGQGEQR